MIYYAHAYTWFKANRFTINLRPFMRMLAVVLGVVCGVGIYSATKNMALSAGIFLLITIVFDWLLVAVGSNGNKETRMH